jgi:hypothetical protein
VSSIPSLVIRLLDADAGEKFASLLELRPSHCTFLVG